ncbi:hypothetical protein ACFRAQ_25890 [Nocardia sp. NPDC056611]|uniref:hypothetical protein n=1 Tax=Nocardia sp. NPDC056611 TaxID=3345877 RepID=UPI00366A75CA
MGRYWHTTDAVVVTTFPTASADTGLDWAAAVKSIPSLDSPSMRAWIADHDNTADARPNRTIVTPNDGYPDRLHHWPHRQVCVPPNDYITFIAMLAKFTHAEPRDR